MNQLHAWGVPHGTDVSDAVAVIVAELAANAVTHGRVPGRDFELRLSLGAECVRVEVTDTRGDPRPPGPADVRPAPPLADSGRGLVLVSALAARWEVVDREPPPGKTVRAEVDLPGRLAPVRARGPVRGTWEEGVSPSGPCPPRSASSGRSASPSPGPG